MPLIVPKTSRFKMKEKMKMIYSCKLCSEANAKVIKPLEKKEGKKKKTKANKQEENKQVAKIEKQPVTISVPKPEPKLLELAEQRLREEKKLKKRQFKEQNEIAQKQEEELKPKFSKPPTLLELNEQKMKEDKKVKKRELKEQKQASSSESTSSLSKIAKLLNS